jgi:hypothetical protein
VKINVLHLANNRFLIDPQCGNEQTFADQQHATGSCRNADSNTLEYLTAIHRQWFGLNLAEEQKERLTYSCVKCFVRRGPVKSELAAGSSKINPMNTDWPLDVTIIARPSTAGLSIPRLRFCHTEVDCYLYLCPCCCVPLLSVLFRSHVLLFLYSVTSLYPVGFISL